jgi:hypothetical protein
MMGSEGEQLGMKPGSPRLALVDHPPRAIGDTRRRSCARSAANLVGCFNRWAAHRSHWCARSIASCRLPWTASGRIEPRASSSATTRCTAGLWICRWRSRATSHECASGLVHTEVAHRFFNTVLVQGQPILSGCKELGASVLSRSGHGWTARGYCKIPRPPHRCERARKADCKRLAA